MLTEQRAAIKAALESGDDKPTGFRAFEYQGEAYNPPCALVVPADPYVTGPAPGRDIPFRKVQLGIDVLLLVPRNDAKQEAKSIDGLIEYAFRELNAIDGLNVRTVSRPIVLTDKVSGSKFVGSVLSIEQLTEEP